MYTITNKSILIHKILSSSKLLSTESLLSPPPVKHNYDFHWFIKTNIPPTKWPSHIDSHHHHHTSTTRHKNKDVDNHNHEIVPASLLLLPVGLHQHNLKKFPQHQITLYFDQDENNNNNNKLLVFSKFGISLSYKSNTNNNVIVDLSTIETEQDLTNLFQTEKNSLEENWLPIPTSQTLYFVCAHNSRDVRCGIRGPIVLDAMRKNTTDNNSKSFPCSHVGGHKFAANVLKVSPLTGIDWFCNVNPICGISILESFSSTITNDEPTSIFTENGELAFTYRGNSWL
jgi:hypothetical protein